MSSLLRLPSELIDHVLSFLGPIDLVNMSSTCRLLSSHSMSDLSWQRHVQENVPGIHITSSSPCSTYRELYISHDPHWFLTKYKVWFCDYFLTGKIIIARYDPRRGCIEGYRLVATKPPPTFDPWEADDEVLIHSFEPECKLHLEQPVLQLDALSLESLMASSGVSKPEHRFSAETPMRITDPNHRGVFSNLLLTKHTSHKSVQKSVTRHSGFDDGSRISQVITTLAYISEKRSRRLPLWIRNCTTRQKRSLIEVSG